MNAVNGTSSVLKEIAFFHETLSFGGAEVVSMDTARRFLARGVRSTFFVTTCNVDEAHRPKDVNVCVLPDTVQQREYFTPANIEKMAEVINHRNIKLMFVVISSMELLRVPDELRRLTPGCRYLYWLHLKPFWEFDNKKCKVRVKARLSLKGWMAAKVLKLPKYALFQSLYLRNLRHKYKKCLNTLDGLVVLHPCYKDILASELHLNDRECNNIYSIINTLDIRKTPVVNKRKRIVYVGRLDFQQKQVDLLLRRWEKIHATIPEWELCFYGTGPAENILKNCIEQRDIPHVSLKGYTSDVQEVYDEAAILCLPSSYEGWPLVLVEAQNNGVVPVAFDSCKCIRHIIGEGDDAAGEFVRQNDWKDFSQRLIHLCQDDAYRAKLQQNCLKKRMDYTDDVNDETWNKLLSEMNLEREK